MRALPSLFCGLSLVAAGPAIAAEAPKPSSAAAPADKMICKRFVRIGTLAGSYRTCKTKHEWDREHENLQKLEVIESCRNRGTGGSCG